MWPPEALEFLRELEDNNDRDWFKANRSRYDQHLLEPTRALAAQLSDLGEPHFFRPYANLRFRQGPPIKEHIAVGLSHGNGGYYVSLSLDGLHLGGGMHHPEPAQLAQFRERVDDEFEAAVAIAAAAGLELSEPALKRAPRGYPSDHPRLDRLRLKELTVHCRHDLEPWLHTPECDERIRAGLDSARPLVSWLEQRIA